ncbi:hypothetical protein R3P38DRAFT_3386800 [Favolaschia claudopus]|uniref:DUF6534 domain-containing protein n=1 Tax=Favolaschia claudopus TaxID=2862362 RepID=A0AAW0DL54_9AGAR
MSTTPEDVKLLLGPIYIGTILSTGLFGICAAQFTNYFISARRHSDSPTIHALVLWEFFLSIFCAIVSVYFVWLYLVENYFNPAFLASAPWPLTAVPMLSGLSACPVQIFMAYRVLRLSNSRFLFVLLLSLTIANGGIAFATSVLAFGLTFDEGSRLTPVADSWLAITVTNDLAVTLLLIFYLHRSRTGFNKTDTVIARLIRSALESAAFATFFSIMVLVMFTVFPRTGFHLMFSQPMGRIYTSTLLSTLNGREALRHDLRGTYDLGETVNVERFNLRPTNNRDTAVAVKITVENQTDEGSNRFEHKSTGSGSAV